MGDQFCSEGRGQIKNLPLVEKLTAEVVAVDDGLHLLTRIWVIAEIAEVPVPDFLRGQSIEV